MTRRTAILWGLGAGQLLAVVIGLALREWATNEWIAVVGDVVFISQFHLAGIWVAFGQRSLPWRLVAVGIALTCLTWLRAAGGWYFSDFIFLFSPGVPATLGTLLLLRLFGFCLHSPGSESQTGDPGRFQFSLRAILIWTAVIAILFSLASLVHPDFAQAIEHVTWRDWLTLFLPIHLLFAGICVGELVILLGMRRPWIGLASLVPVVLALFGLLGWTQSRVAIFIWVGTCTTLWFTISFVPLRSLGYRFGRCRRGQQQEEAMLP